MLKAKPFSLGSTAIPFTFALLAAALYGCADDAGTSPTDGGLPAPCNSPPGNDGGAYEPPPYLVMNPPLQDVRIIDLAGETPDRALLARSLQGLVNRQGVRIYILDDQDSEDNTTAYAREAHMHWLSVYQDQKLINVTATGTLDDALKAYAAEVEGYYLASTSELWSINAASTAAATRSAVIATSAVAASLESLGIHQLDSFVGRWPDALSCYNELANKVGTLPHPGFAIMANPQSRLYDFLIEQGVLALGGYQSMPEWAGVQKALSLMPQQAPLYGYPATNGGEELNAISDISRAGDVLVASDTAPNVSFHMAVKPTTVSRPQNMAQSIDCSAAELNVVIGLSDGDNLIIPLMQYPTSRYWLSADRGRIPIVWSISGALSTVAPAAFDYYARTLAPGDELVEMIGPGYAYGSKMPNADWFYGVAFSQLQASGLRVLWLFDPLESGTGTYSWNAQGQRAMACGQLAGLLDGYYPSPLGAAPPEETVGIVPILRAGSEYSDMPAEIAADISMLLALPRAERPPVVFYSAAVWSNDIPTLVQTLLPFEQQGVRFLSASTAMQCVPH